MWFLQVGVDLLKLAICWCHFVILDNLCVLIFDAMIT